MNIKRLSAKLFMFWFLTSALFACGDSHEETTDPDEVKNTKRTFKEVDAIVANYGQGFLNSPRFQGSTQYLRLQWDQLEPQQGVYDWSVIDDAIKKLNIKKGESMTLRVMCSNAHSPGYYCSPKWLFDEGCKGKEYLRGGNSPEGGVEILRIEPYYDDPIFLKRHAEFIVEFGKKYNNNPMVSVIDIGSYGNWGEWHVDFAPPASIDVRKKIVDMYNQAFPDTYMVFMTDDDKVLPYGLQNPRVGMRRDGVGSPKLEKEWAGSYRYQHVTGMADVWKSAPIIFEWWGNYDYMLENGWSYEASINFMLNNHVSLILDNVGTVPTEKISLLTELAKKAGTRLVLNSVEHINTIEKGSSLDFKISISNKGVAKLYPKYKLRFFIYDAGGKVVYTQDGTADPNSWLPGDYKLDEQINFPQNLASGTYKIGLAVVDSKGNLPFFKLAVNLIPKEESYIVSEVKVE